jgi:hypothetical protein
MTINLRSMALAMPHISAHPNRQPFRGILTLVDSPSDRPPAGARGHRVILSRAAAEAAIPSLLGMGLDFTASFDGHDARKKVGIITAAEIVPLRKTRAQFSVEAQSLGPAKTAKKRVGQGFSPDLRAQRATPAFTVRAQRATPASRTSATRVEQAFRPALRGSWEKGALVPEGPAALEVQGFLFARDFPDVVRELRAATLPGAGSQLGMSYEIANARVADLRAQIWLLTEVTFTGAAVLRRDKAAYSQTSIELIPNQSSVLAHQSSGTARTPDDCERTTADSSKEKKMNEEVTQQFLSTASRLAAAAESLEQALTRLDSGNQAVTSKIDRIIAAVEAEDENSAARVTQLEARIAELERVNSDLKANATRATRKTQPPLVTTLLAKHGLEAQERMDPAVLEKTLAPLSVEQRIAVKAQMARAGIIA